MKLNIKAWRSMSADERINVILEYVPDVMKSVVKVK